MTFNQDLIATQPDGATHLTATSVAGVFRDFPVNLQDTFDAGLLADAGEPWGYLQSSRGRRRAASAVRISTHPTFRPAPWRRRAKSPSS